MSKLYLMLRVLYNVPDSVMMDDARIYAGWIRAESDITGEYTRLLYPLGWNDFPIDNQVRFVIPNTLLLFLFPPIMRMNV